MNAPLSHKANIVSELVERLGDAATEDDADFLAEQLQAAGDDLQSACAAVLRSAKYDEADAEAIKSIEADNRARRQRLERRSEAKRAAVAWAMAEAGIAKLTPPDMTVSLRQNKPSLVTTVEPDLSMCEAYPHFVRMKEVYSFDKDAIRAALDAGETLEWASLNNAPPSVTVRTK